MVDIPGDATTTTGITVDGPSVTNTLEVVGDHDWIRINLTAGQAITVALNGVTLADPYLRIRDASGAIIYENDDISTGVNLNSRLSFAAPSSGVYYIDVGSYNDETAGDYQVTVTTWTQPPIYNNDQITQQLTNGYWGGSSHRFTLDQTRTLTVNLTGLNADGQNLARAALAQWSEITGITFQETAGTAKITFDDNGTGAYTDSNYSNGVISTSFVNIDDQWLIDYGPNVGGYAYQAYLHEIGHALGLGHAGNYNTTANYPYDALFRNDSWATSVMSYFSQTENTYFQGLGFQELFLVTPMVADIIAVGQLYGLSTTTRSGDTTYGFNSNAGTIYSASSNITRNNAYTIFDTGGIDTLDYSGYAFNQVINLNPETFSNIAGRTGNVSIARGTIIENAIGGSMRDIITGNSSANTLTSGQGVNESLTGGAGNDTFLDTIEDHVGDTITDFSVGDRIVFSNATFGNFNFSLSGSTLSFTGGSMTLTGGVNGTLVASAAPGGGVQLTIQAAATTPFANESLVLTAFGYSAGGWTSDDRYHRVMADVNGDGRADIVGFGNDGVYVALGNASGSFNPSQVASLNFGFSAGAGGWTSNNTYPRELADVNNDGRADIVAFGEGGTYVALGQANGTFGAAFVATAQFGRSTAAGGWTSDDRYHRALGDVNGDGRADIVGFGNDGVYVALGQANGTFAAAQVGSANFGYNVGAGGWTSDNTYPRVLADVNGDTRADIVAFGEGGTYVALGQANGTFGAPIIATGEFGRSTPAGGWTSNDVYYREMADVNNDGRADIVGFGQSAVYVALGQANGTFAASQVVSGNFGSGPEAGGWGSQDTFPRHLADINNDGFVDLVGFGASGVYV
ncbi:MAG: matrixin family metalloprotease, partial [Sphingomonas sp.]|nr:matrixin family metalloprotease [Sphingomonas sp.]